MEDLYIGRNKEPYKTNAKGESDVVVVASYLLRVPEMDHLGGCWYPKSNEFVKMR